MFEQVRAVSQAIVCWCLQHSSTQELFNLQLADFKVHGKVFEIQGANEDSNLLG
jgi:hypothetical protein